MNRTDRLHALTEELRRAGSRGRTARRLAAWLEVSTRTVKRDVGALQQAGVPIWASAGPGGGYVLDAAATLPPVNLTAAQAVAVAVALAGATDVPFAADGRAALEKVLDVLGPAARAEVERLGSRVWVRGRPGGRPDPAPVVEDALARRRVVAISYRDRAGTASRRRVEPHLFARTGDHWYLVGWCRERDAPRWFRWDRIEAADLTTEPAPAHDPAVFGAPPADAHSVRTGAAPVTPPRRPAPG
ncbi:putative DNA-binding transcriptional regulator YafY [Geodermatophilus bullaregiensis]|uniref:helix-turn-helix transcriptional regulator n=1 Tax=Geodermatophilus bullaregiensis TaxID=1564160 RepID=UPI00195B21E6|nr:WYL domain-containing protein [Geodermatophilus bullaregiensis]MBM7805913.1 putative DNA-binding transcriptional regulator YafY [Geodermatophilus bullaregiensis]